MTTALTRPMVRSKLRRKSTLEYDTDTWGTPLNLYRYYDRLFHFCADIAASDRNHLHEKYYTKENSAFNYNWFEDCAHGEPNHWVYLNEPYSDPGAWMDKCVIEHQRGLGIVMLTKEPCGGKYFRRCVEGKAREVIFISGRIRFRHPETLLPTKGTSFGNYIVIWDPEHKKPEYTKLSFVDAEEFDRI